MKQTITPLMIFGIVWLAVVAVSWLFFSGWRESPGGLLTLIGLSAVGVLAFLKGGMDYLKAFNEISKPDLPKPEPPAAPSNQMGNPSQSGDGTNVIVQGGNVTIQSPPKPDIHDTIGFIPAAKAVTYVHRGKIEDDVIAHIRKGGRGAIVGVHAPGGLGKTELAKRAAQELKGEYESLWVDVGKKEPQQIIGELLLKCGVQTQPTDSYEYLKNELQHAYQTKKFLVILDDVREESLNKLEDILPPSSCAALVTSRIQQVGGVRNFELGSMTWEQARELFEAVLTEEVVAKELETAKTLAERCKFNPLAMEIAARRIRQFEGMRKPVERYFELAQTKFSELKMQGDQRWDMDRIFDISYLDLSADDQQRFQMLSAFYPTGFSIEAVVFLWNAETSLARNLLSRFINLSLVKTVETDIENLERYRLHDLLDEYTTPKLKASGRYNETKTSLAQWLVNLFTEHYTEDVSTAPHVAVERDNLLHACEWARGEKQAEILAILTTKTRNWFYVNFTEAWVQWFAWLEACLQLGVSDIELKANVLQAIGDVQQFRKEVDAALESYNEALRLFKEIGAKLGEANVRKAIGDVQQFRKEMDAALESYNAALTLFKAVGAKLGEANVYLSLGGFKRTNKDFAGAKIDFQNAFNIYKLTGDQYSQARALYRLGDCLSDDEKFQDALGYYEQAAELWHSIGVNNLVESILDPRIEEVRKHL